MLKPLFCIAALASLAEAQQPAYTAAPSTRASSVVTLSGPRGTTLPQLRIKIDYGQPHLRGRALHTGDLVPLDSVWRLGANDATAFETDVDLTIGGVAVPKGKYTLYALPTAASWKLIVNKNTGQWGTDYVAAQDLARIDLHKRILPMQIESLSIALIPSRQPGAPSGELRIMWGDTELTTNWVARP